MIRLVQFYPEQSASCTPQVSDNGDKKRFIFLRSHVRDFEYILKGDFANPPLPIKKNIFVLRKSHPSQTFVNVGSYNYYYINNEVA